MSTGPATTMATAQAAVPTSAPPPQWPPAPAPNHLQLPQTDGAMVENFLEHPQSMLLTSAILPILRRRHPDRRFAIGQNSGIYWRLTDPPLLGCKAPDWFYVPNVPPELDGHYRRSYVLWQEGQAPLIVMEIVSGDGKEEHDRTPLTGKFWVYEQGIRVPYYVIYDPETGSVEVYRLAADRYDSVPANERGHYPIEPLGVELGVWYGYFVNNTGNWLRWWDAEGNLLPTEDELAEQEHQRAEHEHQRAEQEHQRAEELAARLRALGVDPEQP
jgi:Uma2 family endonuclease